MKNTDFDKLEDMNFTFRKDAFRAKTMYCGKCDRKMKIVSVDFPVSKNIKVKLNMFKCSKGHEEMLNFEEAKKLDKALILNRIISNTAFGFKRKLSHDGDNYLFRLPSELTQGKKHSEITIIPLEKNEALIKW
ncbi:MAG TPA: hypothetical protein VJB90_04290 [Candidatus Nanoarchaeia archaeon]|nr:hypothetical protein [Candidatus Nanoarchaeia archaeon]